MVGRRRAWRAVCALPAALILSMGMADVAAGAAYAATPTGSTHASTESGSASYTPAGCNAPPKTTKPGVRYARCFALLRSSGGRVTASAVSPNTAALGPADIQAAYRLPATGQGQTVAIVDAFGDSAAEADLSTFRSHFGLPACTTANGCFRKVDQTGGVTFPGDSSDWALETSLDLDAVSSACPNCHILLVEAGSDALADLGAAEDEAVALGAKFVSNSYGWLGEFTGETAYNHYYDHPGVAVTASTGDVGDVTNWPASDPNVIAVGGTTLTRGSGTARGWSESVWGGGGSGCSPEEPRPAYQASIVTGCTMRAIADVSADADPVTGLAVYDTMGYGGWMQVGGTSLAAPLVASMYALAGTPTPNSYPVTYPYQKPGGLFDVTEGTNGECGNVLCQAGPGWDGPTGLGTPNGVAALSNGPHGDLAGQVTDAGTGKPIGGAVVTLTPSGYSATTDASGHYDVAVPPGSYAATATTFGYTPASRQDLTVTQDQTATANFTLTAVPGHTVTGTVTDSGHHWPVYAAITIDGYPHGTIYTDPYTGAYSVTLPENATYTLHTSAISMPGYQTDARQVVVGTGDVTQNVGLAADATTCRAPGYGWRYTGTGTDFTGWTGNTPRDGWTVSDGNNSGQTWTFDNPLNISPPPGGDLNFAGIQFQVPDKLGPQDTSLTSPAVTLPSQPAPAIDFDTTHDSSGPGAYQQVADVDLSLDGGRTWSHVWENIDDPISGHVSVPIPQAAGKSGVRVRFHYVGYSPQAWDVDNVVIGGRTCAPISGGIVAGAVTDANTHGPVDGATITSADKPAERTVSASLPSVPGAPGGYYWMFSSLTGNHPFTVTEGHYTPAHDDVGVAADAVTRHDWTLAAGRLTAKTTGVTVTQPFGGASTATVTVTNDGTSTVHATLGTQDGGFTPMAGLSKTVDSGAPLVRVKVPAPKYPLGLTSIKPGKTAKAAPAKPAPSGAAKKTPPPVAGTAWTSIANYPIPIMDNAMASFGGKLYSVGGMNTGGISSTTDASYVYDPRAQSWSPIAPLPVPLLGAGAAFIDGKMYVVGGITRSVRISTATYVYDPQGNSWARVADLPGNGTAGAGIAVLGGDLYVVGGYSPTLRPTSTVYRYDPRTGTWSKPAPYPLAIASEGCAGIAAQVVCANGQTGIDTTAATYRYQPATNTWTQGADSPYSAEGVGYAGSGGKLQIAGGLMIFGGGWYITNQAVQYDPVANLWSDLPRQANALENSGSACGLYQVGGDDETHTATDAGEVLPGYDQCGGTPSWLSVPDTPLTLAPGQSATVTVTVNSASLSQPGDYTGGIWFDTDTPYVVTPVSVTDHVTPPASWAKLTGTVTDASDGTPIDGATVQVCTQYQTKKGSCGPTTFTLTTDANGHFQLWLSQSFSPLMVSAARDGYQPRARIVTLKSGTTSTVDFTLTRS